MKYFIQENKPPMIIPQWITWTNKDGTRTDILDTAITGFIENADGTAGIFTNDSECYTIDDYEKFVEIRKALTGK